GSESDDGPPPAARLAREREEGERRDGERGRALRADREGEGERGESEFRTRAGHREVRAGDEERGDHQVVERRRRLQDDHRERREREGAECGAATTQAETPRDAGDREAASDKRQ